MQEVSYLKGELDAYMCEGPVFYFHGQIILLHCKVPAWADIVSHYSGFGITKDDILDDEFSVSTQDFMDTMEMKELLAQIFDLVCG